MTRNICVHIKCIYTSTICITDVESENMNYHLKIQKGV